MKMCGIIGYVGSQKCVQILFEGLKRLEYRGYDSAGIAVVNDQEIALIRAAGKLVNLEPLLKDLPEQATAGMGHTRWATHGPPVVKNAHPHITDGLAIVHNGIIENFGDLRTGLEGAGVEFSSDTDTEVILHLLRRELDKHSDSKKAILSLLSKLKGAFSLGILIPKEDDRIYLVKLGSPLVVGLGDKESFFASDVAALVSHTKRIVVLKDGQFARLGKESFDLWDFDGQPLEIEEDTLEWSADAIEKAGFSTFMAKEINEQPAVLSKMITRFINFENGQVDVKQTGVDKIDLGRVRNIHMVGCGTAYLSAAAGRYYMEPSLNIPVNVELASEFRYRNPCIDANSLIIAMSQSGETLDTLECLKMARQKGCQILSVCNKEHTEIPRHSDATLYMGCGPEIGVASTKAFTAMVLSHYFITKAMAQKLALCSGKDFALEFDDLRSFPYMLQQVLESETLITKVAQDYFQSSHFIYIGRGINSAIASEGALKLKEISYIHAEAYAAGELKHGPIALIDRFMPVMAIVAQDHYYDKSIANIEEVRAREGKVIGVGPEGDPALARLCEHTIAVPQLKNPILQAILNVIPLQLFSYHMAVFRGTDVDQPRNLAKSVTVE
jgi:glutamine---fructose-6-phosphate transaminase (isomerizing)